MTEIKLSPTDRRLLAALESDGDSTPNDLSELLGYDHPDWINRKLRGMLAAGVIRVASFLRNTDGLPIPVYSLTPGPSAKRPGAQSYSVYCKRYRKLRGARGGMNSLAALVSITGRRAC